VPYFGWYFDCPPNCTLALEKTKRKNFDLGYLEKLTSSQVNKKEDIDKRRKKKKDAQVYSTLGATQTLVDFENPNQNVNPDLFEF
jgi:hypothetical protein